MPCQSLLATLQSRLADGDLRKDIFDSESPVVQAWIEQKQQSTREGSRSKSDWQDPGKKNAIRNATPWPTMFEGIAG